MKIVRQRDLKDCGVCSLLSIIRFYGGDVSLEQLRLDAHANSEGTKALDIIETGKKYGFDAMGLKLDNLDDKKIFLPAIAHVTTSKGLQHYVVIYKITNNKVVLMDPAKGKVIKAKSEFMNEWSKILLVFYPKRKITILKPKNSLLKTFIKVIMYDKKLLFKIVLFSIFLMLFSVASSYYFKVVLDAINSNYDLEYLKILVLIFAIIISFKLVFEYLRNYLENFLNKNIDVFLNSDFIDHIFKLPLESITSRSSGEILTRVNELANIKSIFTEIFINYILDFFLIILSMPLLLNINNILFFILLITILLYLIIGIISSKIIYKKAYKNIEYEADFNNLLLEDINMINSIKNLNVTENRLKNIEYTLVKYLKDNFDLNSFLNKESILKNSISEISFFIVNTVGFYLVYLNTITITSLITFNTLITLFLNPIKTCIDSLPKYFFLKATYTKINDFLSINEEVLGDIKELNNDIIIDNLNYSYNKVNNIIDNLNVNIKSNSFVSFNGPSGSGKSTVCKIINKYINDYEGNILIGGINIKDLSINTIRSNITYVSQDERLITGTIKENIILERDISDEEFYQVCNVCNIENIVSKKVFRYNTSISDYSSNISGGEKQRIILARALLKKSKILILDEALSEVDLKLEKDIIKNIKKYYKDKTIIYISHKKHNNIYDDVISFGGNNELS